MIQRSLKPLALISFFLAASMSAQAQVQKEKDWMLESRADAILGTASCVASTSVATSKISVKTELLFPQGDDKAPLIVLKAKSLGGLTAKAYVRPDSKTLYPLLLIGSDAVTGEDTFVLSPMRLPETLQIIAEKNTLDVYFGEGTTAILARVSLKGSAVTIRRAAACRTSKVILKESLFNELKKDAHLAQAQSGTVHDMLAAYQEAAQRLNERAAAQLALVNHQKAGAAILAQERTAASNRAAAAQREQDTMANISKIQARISDLQARIQKANAELPGLQSQRPALVNAVTNAENAVAPLRPQVQRLRQEVSSAEQAESSIESSISSMQSQLSSLQRQVQALESETDQVRNQQRSLENEIQRISSEISRLESDYRNFDERREADRILNNSSRYRDAARNLENWTRRNRELPAEVERARADANRAEELATICRSQKPPGPPTGGPLPPREVPTKPGRVTGGDAPVRQVPGEPAQPAAVDCSREESAAVAAKRAFEQKKNELQQSDREIANAEREIQRLQDEARREARQRKDEIANQISRLGNEQRNKRDEVSRLDSRIRDIQQVEIPRKTREIDSVRRNISDAQSQLSNAQSRTRSAVAALESYKRSVNYDQLVANLEAAQSRLSNLDSAIASAQNLIQKGPGQVAQSQAELQAQQQELVNRTAARQQADAALAQASQAVAAHASEEGRLSSALVVVSEAFAASKAKTQGISKALYGY